MKLYADLMESERTCHWLTGQRSFNTELTGQIHIAADQTFGQPVLGRPVSDITFQNTFMRNKCHLIKMATVKTTTINS